VSVQTAIYYSKLLCFCQAFLTKKNDKKCFAFFGKKDYNVYAFPAVWQGRGSGSGREAGKIKGG
jgi:hypothetical protein